MGPTLAVQARRAAEAAGHKLEIIAASRFTSPELPKWFESRGISAVRCDLLDPAGLHVLPETENVLYLVGLKFGTSANPALTWASNTLIPAHVMRRFPNARTVALSTGNVYPLVPVASGGSVETDLPAPSGEYAQAALARERIFEYFSQTNQTPLVLVRLNYAVEVRYGVLVDLAKKIARGETIDLSMGHFNCIWQRDANELILRLLSRAEYSRAIYNLTGSETLSVREVASELAANMGQTARFGGQESPTALLNNASKLLDHFGPLTTPLSTILSWVADWVKRDQPTWNKPTHFEVRDGKF